MTPSLADTVTGKNAITDGQAIQALNKTDPNAIDIGYYTGGLGGVNQAYALHFGRSMFITVGALLIALFLGRTCFWVYAQIRLWVTVGSDCNPKSQRYFSIPKSPWISGIKKHLLYAPISRKRHNQEIQISAAINMGTLPTRLHFFMLMIYIVSNIIYCTVFLEWGNPRPMVVADFRGRTGVMATVNMVPLFILAGRNNPLIKMLHISFDTYNIFHRWMGRIVALESVAHTVAWLINKLDATGWEGVMDMIKNDPFIWNGLISTAALIFILLHSPSPIRHAFYETFLHLHILLAIAALVGLYFHLAIAGLPQTKYMYMVFGIWGAERLIRFIRILYYNVSRRGSTQVKIEALPGEVSRVTFKMPRPWTFRPGQHVYVYLPSISLWQSHPFSLAWSDEKPAYTWESSAVSEKKGHQRTATAESGGPTIKTMSILVHKRTGMTATLYNRAAEAPNKTLYVSGFLEGPYGGLHNLDSYGTSILIAGGVGITHQIPYVRHMIQGYNEGTVSTRKITVIWIIREMEQLEWIRTWMYDILPMEGRRDILKFLIFVSKPNRSREITSPSNSIQLFPGRPIMNVLLPNELNERVGTVAVSVCGPGSLSDSVRQVVRTQVQTATVDYFEEAFTW